MPTICILCIGLSEPPGVDTSGTWHSAVHGAPSDSGTGSGGVTWVGMESEWVKEAKVILYPHLMGSLLPHPLPVGNFQSIL